MRDIFWEIFDFLWQFNQCIDLQIIFYVKMKRKSIKILKNKNFPTREIFGNFYDFGFLLQIS